MVFQREACPSSSTPVNSSVRNTRHLEKSAPDFTSSAYTPIRSGAAESASTQSGLFPTNMVISPAMRLHSSSLPPLITFIIVSSN